AVFGAGNGAGNRCSRFGFGGKGQHIGFLTVIAIGQVVVMIAAVVSLIASVIHHNGRFVVIGLLVLQHGYVVVFDKVQIGNHFIDTDIIVYKGLICPLRIIVELRGSEYRRCGRDGFVFDHFTVHARLHTGNTGMHTVLIIVQTIKERLIQFDVVVHLN